MDNQLQKLLGPEIRKGKIGWANVPDTAHSVLVQRDTGRMLLDRQRRPIKGPRVGHHIKSPVDLQAFMDGLEEFEGFSAHMYLDTKGLVTVGFGHQIKDAHEAASLRFFDERTRALAAESDAADAYLQVKDAVGLIGQPATAFKDLTHLELSKTDAASLAFKDVDEFIQELENGFVGFETFPEPAKRGLLDLIFNLGATTFFAQFEKLRNAVAYRNWRAVALESSRRGINQSRNNYVRDLFLKAAKAEPFFIDPKTNPNDVRAR